MPRIQSSRARKAPFPEREADLTRREARITAAEAELRRRDAHIIECAAQLRNRSADLVSANSDIVDIVTNFADRVIEAVSPIPPSLQSAALSDLLARAHSVKSICASASVATPPPSSSS